MALSIAKALIEERTIVDRLLQLCLHDYTTHDPFTIGDDGMFGYHWLDLYWSSPRRHPYLFRVEGELAGFAFVREREEDEVGDWQWEIAEFFILRGIRRGKIGTTAALALLRSRCGVWEISYDVANTAARHFWASVAASLDVALQPNAVTPTRERFLVNVKSEEASDALSASPLNRS